MTLSKKFIAVAAAVGTAALTSACSTTTHFECHDQWNTKKYYDNGTCGYNHGGNDKGQSASHGNGAGSNNAGSNNGGSNNGGSNNGNGQGPGNNNGHGDNHDADDSYGGRDASNPGRGGPAGGPPGGGNPNGNRGAALYVPSPFKLA